MSQESKLETLNRVRGAVQKSTPARDRLVNFFDAETFVELDPFVGTDGQSVGVITGYGYVMGCPVYAFSQDVTEDSGAMSRLQALKVKKVYDLALKTGAPVVAIYDSAGAKLTEGFDALSAYGELLQWSNNLSGVVPQISLILGTCAGSAAMIACSADFVLMSKDAELFLTAPFTAKAAGEGVEGAGTADNAAKAGVAHLVCEDDKAVLEQARRLICLLPLNNLASAPLAEFSCADAGAYLQSVCENLGSMEIKKVISSIVDTDSIVELQSDFGCGAFAALATLGGYPCAIAATDRTVCGGKLDADACAKIARLVSIADAFSLPVITFVDTEGFVPSSKAELAGSLREAAKLAHVYAEATTAKISVILGNAYGPAYIALAGKNAGADLTYAWPSAVISPLAPDAAITVLWTDRLKDTDRASLVTEYCANNASPFEACKTGTVDGVIDPATTRDMLISAVDLLSSKRISTLPKKHSNLPL